MSGLELVYWLTLGIGLGMLFLSMVLGGILDSFDIDFGDAGIPIVPVLFGSIAAFGAGGLLGTKAFGFGAGGSIALGLGTGAAAGTATVLLFLVLKRQEQAEGFEVSRLVGVRGRTTLAIGPGRVGRVSVHYAGMTRSLTATSREDIPAGVDIVVEDVVGGVLTVGPAGREETARPG